MPQRVAISGSTGFLGQTLVRHFQKQNAAIFRLVRPGTKLSVDDSCSLIHWDVDSPTIEAQKLEGMDVVIHLAGASLAAQRWSEAYKHQMLDSRIESTRLLAKTLAGLKRPPKIFFCASAVGFYGNHAPEKIIDESGPKGQGFLADVCEQWEEETEAVKAVGIRVVHLRCGMILGRGGALAKMKLPFQMGLGGVLGSGRQMISWIAADEIPLIIEHLLNTNISGPVNCVCPEASSNRDFTRALGHALRKPTVFPVPGFMVKLLFGEMGQTLLLDGVNVKPQRLLEAGYQFRFVDIRKTLEMILHKWGQ